MMRFESTSAHQEKPKSNHLCSRWVSLFFTHEYKIVLRAFLLGKETLFIMT